MALILSLILAGIVGTVAGFYFLHAESRGTNAPPRR